MGRWLRAIAVAARRRRRDPWLMEQRRQVWIWIVCTERLLDVARQQVAAIHQYAADVKAALRMLR